MHYVLGVDGGNSKTIALVASLDGTILGAGRGGCGDIYNAHPIVGQTNADAALANIEFAVLNALEVAGVNASDLVTAVFSMAGADWPEDFVFLRTALAQRGFGRTIIVQNDALSVLHARSSGATGVSVICGTGGATGARGPDGRVWHSSFWQDQVQGAGDLGQQTLNAVYRSALGIEPPTSLTQRVLDFFHQNTVEEVLHLFTNRLKRRPSQRIDHLTPLLLDEAEAGDEVARRIVQGHGTALGDYALAGARHVGIEGTAFPLVFAGGVFRHPSSLLADTVIERVHTTSPEARPMRSRFEPIIGVLFTALEAAGVEIDDQLVERLVPTMPLSTLFVTVPD
ncbi:MAG TPA: BadF/BadG/BcrA/BcrD ATPase family protein [Ktedonobacteraceae bacterium]|nr:BadF/BadG/BcrA/BcrD ATPase family protein [Ktedonobacteraceae bacterium]